MSLAPEHSEFIKEEYIHLKQEQAQRIGFRDNMIFMQLAAIGGIASWCVTNLDKPEAVNAFLLVPWVCTILGWTYVVNDYAVSRIGKYIRDCLTPHIEHNITIEFAETDSGIHGLPAVFGWEPFHRMDDRRVRRKWFQWFVDEFTFVAPGILSLVVYCWMQTAANNMDVARIIISALEAALMITLAAIIFIYSNFERSEIAKEIQQ